MRTHGVEYYTGRAQNAKMYYQFRGSSKCLCIVVVIIRRPPNADKKDFHYKPSHHPLKNDPDYQLFHTSTNHLRTLFAEPQRALFEIITVDWFVTGGRSSRNICRNTNCTTAGILQIEPTKWIRLTNARYTDMRLPIWKFEQSKWARLRQDPSSALIYLDFTIAVAQATRWGQWKGLKTLTKSCSHLFFRKLFWMERKKTNCWRWHFLTQCTVDLEFVWKFQIAIRFDHLKIK